MDRQPEEKRQFVRLRNNAVEVFGRRVPLPQSRAGRVTVGILFVIGGIFSFLPVLGLWMLPVGLLILSVDFVIVRRWRRRMSVRWGRRKQPKTGVPAPPGPAVRAATEVGQPVVHHPER